MRSERNLQRNLQRMRMRTYIRIKVRKFFFFEELHGQKKKINDGQKLI